MTTEGQAPPMTYEPMTNDRREFDPVAGEWGYILDDTSADTAWRGMVPLSGRPFTWPYRLHTIFGRNPYGSARLAPDWCFYAWSDEYVLASWSPAAEHAVTCRTTLYRRYGPEGTPPARPGDNFAGVGNDRWVYREWRLNVTLDLLRGAYGVNIVPDDGAQFIPADVQAEGEAKAAKLLAFFQAECLRWQAGELARPQQAYELVSHDG